jgi:hypothetical protein
MDELLLAGNKEEAFDKKEADFNPKTKKLILISCLSALCVGNMMLDAVYAFMPIYINERNDTNDWSSDDAAISAS